MASLWTKKVAEMFISETFLSEKLELKNAGKIQVQKAEFCKNYWIIYKELNRAVDLVSGNWMKISSRGVSVEIRFLIL